jgi:hypothetical protein
MVDGGWWLAVAADGWRQRLFVNALRGQSVTVKLDPSKRERKTPGTVKKAAPPCPITANSSGDQLMRIYKPLRYLVFVGCAWGASYSAAQPSVVGWIEPVRLGSEGLVIPAKLDTGADTSSLHASDITWSRRADGDWVAFEVMGKDNRKVRLERKVQRVTRVKKAAGGIQERPVVLLGVCLGDTYRETEVNLTDRTGFKLPFLVGRSFLADRFAVDSSRTETIEPACSTTTASATTSG